MRNNFTLFLGKFWWNLQKLILTQENFVSGNFLPRKLLYLSVMGYDIHIEPLS